MIAVQVLSQTVSSNAMNTSRSAETENSVKTSMDTTDVVSLLQEQLSAGTQMYSLQISGQTIPFTTIQLPMLQQTEHHQSASTSAETPVLQQLTGDISQNISTLGASSSQLGLTCPPEKERPSFAEGVYQFLWIISICLLLLLLIVSKRHHQRSSSWYSRQSS